MDPGSTLQTLAEISIAFTGFSALIVALRAPQVGGLDAPGNRLGLALLFGWSLGAVVMSLVPLILSAADATGRSLWAVSSGIGGLFFGVALMATVLANARLPRDERIGRGAALLGTLVHLAAMGALLANATGPASPAVLLGSIVVMLGIAAWTMLYFIFPPDPDPEEHDEPHDGSRP